MKNGELKIEKNVPIPKNTTRKGKGHVQLVLRALKKGESVVLPGVPQNAYSAARKYIGAGRYTIRPDKGGSRVWRIK